MMPRSVAPTRLLERLSQETAPQSEEPTSRLASIRRHLELLLNCRLDSCRSAPDLGISDFNASHLATHDLHEQIADAICDCLQRYEPRLQQIRVNHSANTEDPLQLAFHIAGEIRLQGLDRRQTTSFTLLFDGLRRERRLI